MGTTYLLFSRPNMLTQAFINESIRYHNQTRRQTHIHHMPSLTPQSDLMILQLDVLYERAESCHTFDLH